MNDAASKNQQALRDVACKCMACHGTHKNWTEREKGVYSAVYCRWCTSGLMTNDQLAKWMHITRKISGIQLSTKKR